MSEPRRLSDDEYGADGWPLFPVRLTPHKYCLALGPQTCWLAEIEALPGYYGEGATHTDALERLLESLGPQPHWQVEHKMRSAERLRRDVERQHKANAAAALTVAPRWGIDRGAGAAVEATAKEFGIGKPSVDAARARLFPALTPSDDQLPVFGASQAAIEAIAHRAAEGADRYEGVAFEAREMELWIAREAPWRLEHADAREMFPVETAKMRAGPVSEIFES